MKPTRGMTPAKRPAQGQDSSVESLNEENKVAVYCRIRGPLLTEEEPCVHIDDGKIVVLTPPEISRAYKGGNEARQYTFTKAFSETSGQKEVFETVGRSLVTELLSGWSSLLFMYGVTGSGKTYTMQGTSEDAGIVARSIDVLFKSIGQNLVSKYQIIPVNERGVNTFQVLTKTDALERKLIEERSKPSRSRRVMNNDDKIIHNISDESSYSPTITEDSLYYVSLRMVEVHNDRIYDLLDNSDTKSSKDLRQDPSNGEIYVNECVEIQVSSAQEAMEKFYQGQRKRRVAHTVLNAESSRSHSVFNIRLVKVQPASNDGEINPEKAQFESSQLSLVDMAGSERTNRTGNTGKKLEEAGNINNSLMTLKMCIKQLRENQKRKRYDRLPTRTSKITHMFEHFFLQKPGCGALRMMVCINPKPADFDENTHVMEFAEMTQKIQIERVEAIPKNVFTAGQLRGNEAYREALRRVGNTPAATSASGVPNSVYSPIYSLGPDWPSLDMKQCDDEDTLDNLEQYLGKRITTRNTLIEDHNSNVESFRARLVELEKENIILREENSRLKGGSDGDRRRIDLLEKKVVNAENANIALTRKNAALEEVKIQLERELDDKELVINANKKQQDRQARKLKSQLNQQTAIKNDLEQKLKNEEAENNKNYFDQARLRAVRKIVASDNGKLLNKTVSDPDVSSRDYGTPWKGKMISAKSNQDVASTPVPTPRRSVAMANTRYRRSRSAGPIVIDHQPKNPVDTNTIMQPSNLKKKRSVTKLDKKDLEDPKCSNYALTTQEQDSDGDVETKIFKGDIIPTCTGGHQVVFNDVETLTQKSPNKSPTRPMTRRNSKRSYEDLATVGSRVAAFENKLGANKRHRR